MAKKKEAEEPVIVEDIAPEIKKSKLPSNLVLITVFFLALLAIVGYSSFYFYGEYKKSQELLKNPPKTGNAAEVKPLIEKIGKLIDLPTNEAPTVATVSDISKLSSQPFFAKAQNGDKVLFYQQNKKAILYRPATNKIIEVSSINVAPQAAAQTASPSAAVAAKPKVVILNGTTKVGLTRTAENALTAAKVDIEVADRDNAAKSGYEETVIVDLTGKNKAIVAAIVKALGGTIGKLPEGQATPPGIDILIILGADYEN